MNLLWLFLTLVITGFIFMKAVPFLVMPIVAPIGFLASRFKNEKNPLVYMMGAVGMLWEMYLLLAWCIVALFFTVAFSAKPAVQHHWMYYLLGFCGCLAPIQAMASYDRDADTATTLKQLFALVVVAVAFIVFQLLPYLMLPWYWLLRLLLHRYA